MAEKEKAFEWAATEVDEPGSFKVLDGFPRDVVAVEATGEITSRAYQEVLALLIEAKLKEHDKLKLFCKVGEAFDSYSLGAAWDDFRLGLSHPLAYDKFALVTDLGWMRNAAKLFGPLMPTEVMVFDLADEERAQEWIRT
ncbi:SpoIIAA family protein [Halovulum sp. GXIMD14793]